MLRTHEDLPVRVSSFYFVSIQYFAPMLLLKNCNSCCLSVYFKCFSFDHILLGYTFKACHMGALVQTTSRTAKMSYENVTSRSSSHFSIIPSQLALKSVYCLSQD